MTISHKISESERLQMITNLDRLPGTRQIANFLDITLPQRTAAEEAKKKSQLETKAENEEVK